MACKLQHIYDVTIVVLSVAFEKNINDIVNIVVISSRYTPKVNKTVQLRFKILKFWLFTHTDENGVILLPHAYRMWNKNSFNKSVIDFYFMMCQNIDNFS